MTIREAVIAALIILCLVPALTTLNRFTGEEDK